MSTSTIKKIILDGGNFTLDTTNFQTNITTNKEISCNNNISANNFFINDNDTQISLLQICDTINAVTSSPEDLNKLDGFQGSTNEMNYLSGVTLGTASAGKVITTDVSNNVTIEGSITAQNLDVNDLQVTDLTTLNGGLLLNNTVPNSNCIFNVPVKCNQNVNVGYNAGSESNVIDNLGIHIISRPVDDPEFTGANLNFYMNTKQPQGAAALAGDDGQVNGGESPLGNMNFYGYDNGSYRIGAKISVEPVSAWSSLGYNRNQTSIKFFAEDESDNNNILQNEMFEINGYDRVIYAKTPVTINGVTTIIGGLNLSEGTFNLNGTNITSTATEINLLSGLTNREIYNNHLNYTIINSSQTITLSATSRPCIFTKHTSGTVTIELPDDPNLDGRMFHFKTLSINELHLDPTGNATLEGGNSTLALGTQYFTITLIYLHEITEWVYVHKNT